VLEPEQQYRLFFQPSDTTHWSVSWSSVPTAVVVPDLDCHGYNNKQKHVDCTESDVFTFVAMVTIMTVMAWLGLGKDADFG